MICFSPGNRHQMLRGGAKEPAAQHPSFLGLPHPVLRGDRKGLYLPYPLCFLSPCLPYENTGDTQTPAFKSHHREFSLTDHRPSVQISKAWHLGALGSLASSSGCASASQCNLVLS